MIIAPQHCYEYSALALITIAFHVDTYNVSTPDLKFVALVSDSLLTYSYTALVRRSDIRKFHDLWVIKLQ